MRGACKRLLTETQQRSVQNLGSCRSPLADREAPSPLQALALQQIHLLESTSMNTARMISSITVMIGISIAAPLAAAQPSVRAFANCTAMHKVYRHGVGRQGAHDKTSGTPVTNFTVSTRIYNANAARDRDHDGIACEQ